MKIELPESRAYAAFIRSTKFSSCAFERKWSAFGRRKTVQTASQKDYNAGRMAMEKESSTIYQQFVQTFTPGEEFVFPRGGSHSATAILREHTLRGRYLLPSALLPRSARQHPPPHTIQQHPYPLSWGHESIQTLPGDVQPDHPSQTQHSNFTHVHTPSPHETPPRHTTKRRLDRTPRSHEPTLCGCFSFV